MTYHRLYYHFVWATKDRLPLLSTTVRKKVLAAIAAKARDLGARVHALNAMPEHVHLVASVPPSLSLAVFIGQVKGSSSHFGSRLPELEAREVFVWQAEYGVVSFSQSDLLAVSRYVERQVEHHTSNQVNRALEIDG